VDLVVGRIAAAIEFPALGRTMPLSADVLLFEVPIAPRARLAGSTVAQIRTSEGFPADCLFIALVDDEGRAELPTGATVLAPGRTAILVARRDQVPAVLACLTAEPESKDPRLAPIAAALRRLPFLTPLDDDEIEKMAAGVALLRRGRGEVIFRENDPGGELFIVLSGEVSLVSASGERAVVGPGAFFGEISLLTGEPRSRTATTRTETELGVVTQDDFAEVVTSHPAIALEMSRVLSQRLAEAARTPRRKRIFGRLI
jgi:trk system potassium uptake protein TrkA